MPSPTSFAELNGVLADLVDGLRSILGDDLVGVYLQGSAAIGDFDEHSDADFVVVVEDELAPEKVAALRVMHHRVFDCGEEWAKHLEGSYFPRATLRDPAAAGTELWYLDNGHRDLERSSHCNTLVVRWTLRELGVTLAGPPPDTLVDPFPTAALQTEIAAVIEHWGNEILSNPGPYRNRFYQTFIMLNFARMLHDLQAGSINSKRTAAEWAKRTLDPSWHDLFDRAWAGRPDPARSVRTPADPDDFARTLEFVRYVMDEAEDTPAAGF